MVREGRCEGRVTLTPNAPVVLDPRVVVLSEPGEVLYTPRAHVRCLSRWALEWLVQEGGQVSPGVYPVPLPVDRRVAELKLQAMGLRIDRLRPEQEEYLAAWQEGT